MGKVRNFLAHTWNAFLSTDQTDNRNFLGQDYGIGYGSRPDRPRYSVTNERSTIASILTRIAIDVADAEQRHVRVDESGRYREDIKSHLHRCLTIEANLDQGARHFRQDEAWSLMDRGTIAIVPVVTTLNPIQTAGFDIKNVRVGFVKEWHPDKVLVNAYNEKNGKREDLLLPKAITAIVENPLFAVMNEPSSTLTRLNRKLYLLDVVDEYASSGKLDIIIQLPYVVKSPALKEKAEQRRADLEFQLTGSKYGIGYLDGTEKITQLNRPAENNLLKQVEDLRSQLYTELGVTPEVMNGTAEEAAMLNYHNRTVRPILDALVEAKTRAFLSKTAQTQGQRIMYFRDPFKNVPISQIAEIADKLTRSEAVTSNEIRQGIGLRPSKDPKADQLRNSNMPQSELGQKEELEVQPEPESAEPPQPKTVVNDRRSQ